MTTLGFESAVIGEPPTDFNFTDMYEERCENEVPVTDENEAGICNGRLHSTGGQHHYSNGFDCYTLFLTCEHCGPYEVECV